MEEWVRVADLSELPPGSAMRVIGPADKPIALFNVDGSLHAINDVCPHRGGPLSRGALRGSVVICPWHGWTFDVRTGQPDHPGGHSVATYRVKVVGTTIYVGWLRGGGGA